MQETITRGSMDPTIDNWFENCLIFAQYFSYIVAISFIGWGNRSTQRKPPTCSK